MLPFRILLVFYCEILHEVLGHVLAQFSTFPAHGSILPNKIKDHKESSLANWSYL